MKSTGLVIPPRRSNFSSSDCLRNVVTTFENRRTFGNIYYNQFYRSAENVYFRRLKELVVCHNYHTDDRRITEIATHPRKPLAISGTKGGGMKLSDLSGIVGDLYQWEGKGPGYSILDCKFCYDDNRMLTASLDGTVKLWNLEIANKKPLVTVLDTGDFDKWFCSVAPSRDKGLTLVGGNRGIITLLDKDYKIISTLKAHKKKVNSIDFSNTCGNLFATASLDFTVKLFDVRKLDSVSLESFKHEKPVNSAVFSKMNGRRLLTTDQHSEIRLYSGPLWNLERTIIHPHRQFQHLTPIRASWHPFLDLIIIGRYPDEKLKGFAYMTGTGSFVSFWNTLKTIDLSNEENDIQYCISESKEKHAVLKKLNNNSKNKEKRLKKKKECSLKNVGKKDCDSHPHAYT